MAFEETRKCRICFGLRHFNVRNDVDSNPLHWNEF